MIGRKLCLQETALIQAHEQAIPKNKTKEKQTKQQTGPMVASIDPAQPLRSSGVEHKRLRQPRDVNHQTTCSKSFVCKKIYIYLSAEKYKPSYSIVSIKIPERKKLAPTSSPA